MGRFRPFLWGAASGGVSYFVMSSFIDSRISSLNSGLRSLRYEINPNARSAQEVDSELGTEGSMLRQYKHRAAESFRKTWNDTIRGVYSKTVQFVRNPYLNPSDSGSAGSSASLEQTSSS